MEDNTAQQQQQQLPTNSRTNGPTNLGRLQRDAALIEALRTIRKQMDIAESETSAAKRRLENAQQVYNTAAHYLAGGGTRDDRVVPLNHDVAVRTVSYNHKSLLNNNNRNNNSSCIASLVPAKANREL
eukprot:scaffold52785_cov48-Cyclotella_meneghiniana.AAC.6